MSYTCYHCDQHTDSGHSITLYDKEGLEDKYEVLCSHCYSEWLLSLKG